MNDDSLANRRWLTDEILFWKTVEQLHKKINIAWKDTISFNLWWFCNWIYLGKPPEIYQRWNPWILTFPRLNSPLIKSFNHLYLYYLIYTSFTSVPPTNKQWTLSNLSPDGWYPSLDPILSAYFLLFVLWSILKSNLLTIPTTGLI